MYTARKKAEERLRIKRDQYNQTVAQMHFSTAVQLVNKREVNEQRIKQLESIEQRLVGNLQTTLLSKNAAMNELA